MKTLIEKYFPVITQIKEQSNSTKRKELDQFGMLFNHEITEGDVRIILETIDKLEAG